MGIGKDLEKAQTRAEKAAERLGHRLVEAFRLLALFVIGATIAWSAVTAYLEMIAAGHASLHDILLLFVYLEMGAMRYQIFMHMFLWFILLPVKMGLRWTISLKYIVGLPEYFLNV